MTLLSAQTAFYYMAAASIVSAILAVTRRNPVHSMLWVLVLFLHVAGIFLLLGAEFLAAVQIIVYAGAILIFYIFVLMLLDLPGEEAGPRFGKHWPLAAAAGLSFAGLAWLALVAPDNFSGVRPSEVGVSEAGVSDVAVAGVGVSEVGVSEVGVSEVGVVSLQEHMAVNGTPQGSLKEIGMALFGPFALPFEIASLILLAAIVGAVVLARKRTAGS